MVVKSRLRAIVFPFFVYAVSGAVSGYFVWHAAHGDRGLKAGAEYEAQMTALAAELNEVKVERQRWDRRVNLMRPGAVDRDLLDEEARATVDRVGRNDLVVYLPKTPAR